MQSLDIKRLEFLLDDIENETEFLSETVRNMHFDKKIVKAIKYSLIVVIEAMLQICQHILAKKYKVPVSGYRDAFKKAARYGIISDSLSRDIQPLAELRNEFLIHGYWKCDDELLIDLIQKNLGDFKVFINEIRAFLSNNPR